MGDVGTPYSLRSFSVNLKLQKKKKNLKNKMPVKRNLYPQLERTIFLIKI